MSAAHALYLASYDSYDIGVFAKRLIGTDLLGVEVIRIKIRQLITLVLFLQVWREQLKSDQ